MQKMNHRRLLNICVLAMASFALAIDIVQILYKTATSSGWVAILNVFEGLGMLLALSLLGFIILPWVIVTISVTALLVIRQVREKKWAWFSVSIIAAFVTFTFASTALFAVGTVYYAFVLRPQLGLEITKGKSFWRGLAIVQALLTVIVMMTLIPMYETTRSIVIKATPGEQAPFDLTTHALSLPQNFPSGMHIKHLAFSPDGTRAAYVLNQYSNYPSPYFVADGLVYDIDPTWYPELRFYFTDDSELLLFLVTNVRNVTKFTEEERREGSFIGMKNRKDDTLHTTVPLQRGEKTHQIPHRTYSFEDIMKKHPEKEKEVITHGARTAEVMTVRYCGMGGECLFKVKVTEGTQVVFESDIYNREVRNLTFSADGRHIAYTVGNPENSRGDGAYVVVDGKRGIIVDSVAYGSLRFSPNGKYIAYGAEKSGNLWWIVEEVIPDAGNITIKSLEKIVRTISK